MAALSSSTVFRSSPSPLNAMFLPPTTRPPSACTAIPPMPLRCGTTADTPPDVEIRNTPPFVTSLKYSPRPGAQTGPSISPYPVARVWKLMRRAPSSQFRDHPERRAAGRHALDVVEAVAEPGHPVVPRRAGRMRRQRDVGQPQNRIVGLRRLVDEHVEPGAGDLLAGERPVQRVLVDDRPAAGVDDHRVRLHERQLFLADHAACRIVERHVQADDVGAAQQLVLEHEPDAERVFLVFGEAQGVVVDDLRVERGDPARDLLADVAEPDDADGLAG